MRAALFLCYNTHAMTKDRTEWLVYILILFALIGLFDASYMTASHFSNSAVYCSLFEGCDVVLASKYATLAGIPIALIGAVYYFFVFAGATIGLITKKESIIRTVARVTTLGFIASLVLVYLQIFVIGSLCQFCMISAATSTLLFIAGMLILAGKGGANVTSSHNETETVQ